MRKYWAFLAAALGVSFLVSFGGDGQQAQTAPSQPYRFLGSRSHKIDRDFGKMPLYFIPNQGQFDARVAYYLQGKNTTIYFHPGGLTYVLHQGGVGNGKRHAGTSGQGLAPIDPMRDEVERTSRWILKLDFVGADVAARPTGEERTETVVSYFKGKADEWRTGLPTYSKIVYKDLWPGIDLAYFGTVGKLKYEFILQPGADPSLVRLAYRGASAVAVNSKGRLEVRTPAGGFEDEEPVAYQDIDGKRVGVDMRYLLADQAGINRRAGEEGTGAESFAYGFEVGEYDRSRPLIMDPAILVYCGYIGGSIGDPYYSYEDASGIAVDGSGNAYVTGRTLSTEATFPVAVGPDLTHNGGFDAFVAKINAAGTGLAYCGFVGGSRNDQSYGIAVDGSGNAYITGRTYSGEDTFPVKVGPGLAHGRYFPDAFVAKINAAGTELVYCGYIAGADADWGGSIAVDGFGNAYVMGTTGSPQPQAAGGFPVKVGPDLTFNGGQFDAFVAKVNALGTELVYCGYIGGYADEGLLWRYAHGIAVDGSGNAYVTGDTSSTEISFPVKAGPDLTYNGGDRDAFVAKVNAAGTGLDYCGYIGGAGLDEGRGIAVDVSGKAYVVGGTNSARATFPVKIGPDLTRNYEADGFVAKVNASGTGLSYCGYIGYAPFLRYGGNRGGPAIAVGPSGYAYVTGWSGRNDVFITKIEAAGKGLAYYSEFGGAGYEAGTGIAVDRAGSIYVTGWTGSMESSFPVKAGPDLTYNGGDQDPFAAKILEATITVTSPNGREAWKLNSSYDIKWNYSGAVGTKIKIELVKGKDATLVRTISSSAPVGANGRGSYDWKIPSNLIVRTNYKIRITSKKYSACSDSSDKYFSIVE